MPSRIAVLGIGVVAVACCGGLRAIGAALGGVTASAVIGVATGLATGVVVGVAAVLFARRRRQRVRTESRR